MKIQKAKEKRFCTKIHVTVFISNYKNQNILLSQNGKL